MDIRKEGLKEARRRRSGPKKIHRTDITLPPSVVEAAVLHAKALKIPQVEYFKGAVAAFFRQCLLSPPEPVKTRCEHCGTQLRTPRSGWKRLRMSTRLDEQSRTFLESLAEDYFALNWSRAFEAAVRFFLGEDRNPPPEGEGRIMGVKLKSGRKASDEEREAAKGKPGRPIGSIEGMVKKHGGVFE